MVKQNSGTNTLRKNSDESLAADDAKENLGRLLNRRPESKFSLMVESKGKSEAVSVPSTALALLADILSEMAKGNTVKVVPIPAELTSQEAADLLNVSRPFLIGLLEKGEIPFSRVGTHRRILYRDLIAYKTQLAASRRVALDALAAQAQELNMGY